MRVTLCVVVGGAYSKIFRYANSAVVFSSFWQTTILWKCNAKRFYTFSVVFCTADAKQTTTGEGWQWWSNGKHVNGKGIKNFGGCRICTCSLTKRSWQPSDWYAMWLGAQSQKWSAAVIRLLLCRKTKSGICIQHTTNHHGAWQIVTDVRWCSSYVISVLLWMFLVLFSFASAPQTTWHSHTMSERLYRFNNSWFLIASMLRCVTEFPMEMAITSEFVLCR